LKRAVAHRSRFCGPISYWEFAEILASWGQKVMGVTTPAERLTRAASGALFTLGAAPSRSPQYQPSGCCSGNRPTTAPIDNRRFGNVPSSHLRAIRLDLMAATVASGDEANAATGGAAERHWRAGGRVRGGPGSVLRPNSRHKVFLYAPA
jgi:hypothetical protein